MKNNNQITFFIVLLFFMVNIISWNYLFAINKDVFRIIFFDVGQGDATLIKTPQNHYILIDGGAGSIVLEKIGEEVPFFNKTIDLIILSHPHDDHVSGLIEVVHRYNVKDIICTGVSGESGVARRWKDIIEENGYYQARAGMVVSANDFSINILYPVEDIKDKRVKDLNEVSVVALFTASDKGSFLFTGDAYKKQELELLSNYNNCKKENLDFCDSLSLKADVLKIGHHGSRTSTAKEFLGVVLPKVAVIMTGEDNRYGHPHSEVIEILEKNKIIIKRTDKDGDIIFEI